MNTVKCKICGDVSSYCFNSIIMNKYDIRYYHCSKCEYLFTEKPYWLEEAYKNPINLSDTGIISRNNYFSQIISIIIFLYFKRNEKFLDYAGGYGIFTRLMRDIGFDFYWHDDFTQNLVSRGFEFKANQKFELLTALEVFEHFENPIEEINKMLQFSENILISTVILPEKIPPRNWWYYGFDHGQHISFYSKNTIKTIGKILGLKYSNLGELHLLSKEKEIKLSPLLLKLLNKSGFLFFISKFQKSKTFSDHVLLKSKSTQ